MPGRRAANGRALKCTSRTPALGSDAAAAAAAAAHRQCTSGRAPGAPSAADTCSAGTHTFQHRRKSPCTHLVMLALHRRALTLLASTWRAANATVMGASAVRGCMQCAACMHQALEMPAHQAKGVEGSEEGGINGGIRAHCVLVQAAGPAQHGTKQGDACNHSSCLGGTDSVACTTSKALAEAKPHRCQQ